MGDLSVRRMTWINSRPIATISFIFVYSSCLRKIFILNILIIFMWKKTILICSWVNGSSIKDSSPFLSFQFVIFFHSKKRAPKTLHRNPVFLFEPAPIFPVFIISTKADLFKELSLDGIITSCNSLVLFVLNSWNIFFFLIHY